jgi:hypothetical protein
LALEERKLNQGEANIEGDLPYLSLYVDLWKSRKRVDFFEIKKARHIALSYVSFGYRHFCVFVKNP